MSTLLQHLTDALELPQRLHARLKFVAIAEKIVICHAQGLLALVIRENEPNRVEKFLKLLWALELRLEFAAALSAAMLPQEVEQRLLIGAHTYLEFLLRRPIAMPHHAEHTS